MKKFDIPEIPRELMLRATRKAFDIYDGTDLEQNDPAITLHWDDPDYMDYLAAADPKRMVEDPEYDLETQLKNIRYSIKMLEAGSTGVGSYPVLNLVHFGTGPIATAFGARMVMQTGIQPHFDPAFHTAEEALHTEMPDLFRGGWLGAILDRIEYYNEATQGKIPIAVSDNAGPWSIATSVWHFEDMLEGILSAPEAVHHLLSLTTRAIIEVNDIQCRMARNAWGVMGDTLGGGWLPRGGYVGDDVMVTVSTPMWKEFFQPYNEILSHRYGGVVYHCCMKHDWHLQAMSETAGFMGFDADPMYNDLGKIESALTGKGGWNRAVTDWEIAKRCKGKFGFFLGVQEKTKEAALEQAKRMVEYIHA